MRFSPILIFCAFVCSADLKAQVKFYSNPEPVPELNSSDAEDYLFLSSDGGEIIYTKKLSKTNVGGTQNPGDIWFGDIHEKPKVDTLFTLAINDRELFYSPIGYTSDKQHFIFNETLLSQGVYSGRVMSYNLRSKEKIQVEIPYFRNKAQFQTGFISRDGEYLLFSLEMNSGYGVEDLYVCLLDQEGNWSEPKNLGRMINTDKQELTPFIAGDNKTLYFATNARGGMGSFDIYTATRLDESWRSWSKPENLGSFVNSEGAETSFMFNEGSEYAYFISTQNSDGYGDIKRVRIYPTPFGLPSDSILSDPIKIEEKIAYEKSVKFFVQHAKTGEKLSFNYFGGFYSSGEITKINSFSEDLPNIEFGLNRGDSLDIEFKTKGFLSASVSIGFNNLEAEKNSFIVKLEPLETGNIITLEHVLFQRGTPDIVESSKRELELVLEMMEDNPEVKIFLKGHTDNVGNKVLNIQLSQARVNAVRDFLVERGIVKDRISGKGYGGSKPIADNRNEETRKLNRRVEFEVRRSQ